MNNVIDRGKLDDTLAAMFSNRNYSNSYLFYAHMISQCSIKIDRTLPAPAGVNFMNDHFNLYINPEGISVPLEEVQAKLREIDKSDASIEDFTKEIEKMKFLKDGKEYVKLVKGFDDFVLVGRLAILKHEMLHILNGHIDRIEDRVHKPWNIAADCALNQDIDKDHLPEEAIMPENMAKALGIKVKSNESAEFYYELLKKFDKSQDSDGEGKGESKPSDIIDKLSDQLLDSHGKWDESQGDKELQTDMTKRMIEKSQDETVKSCGSIPSQCSDWINLHSRKSEVNWKQVLRRIVGNKRVGKRSTIMRKSRRFPQRADLRGTVKNRVFNLLVVADVSGSMSTAAVSATIQEVKNICDLTQSDLDLIQIDSAPHEPEKVSKSMKIFTRKSAGGTELFPAISKAKERKIDYQAVVVLTDGYLFSNEVDNFRSIGKKVIWLIEPEGQLTDDMNQHRMQGFKLSAQNEKSDD